MTSYAINQSIHQVKAFAPATSANFAVGYDLIGFALEGAGDTVSLTRREDHQLVITAIRGAKGAEKLPFEVEKNVSSAVIRKFLDDHKLSVGFDIEIEKGITLGSGMGGSAASSVAALIALNAFLVEPCPLIELVNYAIYGESLISGSYHGDNAVPCMMGGLVLLQSSKPCQMIALPVPDCQVAIICPDLSIETRQARLLLQEPYPISEIVAQSSYLAATICALYTHDLKLLGANLKDVLIEPRRAPLITGYYDVQRAAYEAGALACGISGSGPTMFALVAPDQNAQMVADAMVSMFAQHHLSASQWISRMSTQGATVVAQQLKG